jgi:hypothetical protein
VLLQTTRSEKGCHQTGQGDEKRAGWGLKKQARSENRLPITAPIRASEISAEVELTPPTSNGADVEENVTQTDVVDIQRYLRWANKALQSRPAKNQDRRGHAPPKAA